MANAANDAKRATVNSDGIDMSNVYQKPLDSMTIRDWRILKENHDIRVKGGKAPNPLRHFTESTPALHPLVVKAVQQTLKYADPSPIQRMAIPIGLQRRDLIGIAETGR